MKVGAEKVRVGPYASVFQMTSRAELALALSWTDFSKLIKEANYAKVIKCWNTHHPLNTRAGNHGKMINDELNLLERGLPKHPEGNEDRQASNGKCEKPALE